MSHVILVLSHDTCLVYVLIDTVQILPLVDSGLMMVMIRRCLWHFTFTGVSVQFLSKGNSMFLEGRVKKLTKR